MTDPMTTAEFRQALDTLGLTIVGAAPYIGLSKRQCQRLASPNHPDAYIPAPVSKLLRIVLWRGIRAERLL